MAGFYSVLEDSVYDCVQGVMTELGYPTLKIVYSNQNGLEPTNEYVVISALDIKQLGMKDEASYIDPNSEDILETVSHYTFCLRLSFMGDNSGNIGADFRHQLINNRKYFEIFQENKFGILKRTDLRRVPQLRESGWVESFNMDIDLSFAINTRQSYDWMEFITVNGEVIRIWNDE